MHNPIPMPCSPSRMKLFIPSYFIPKAKPAGRKAVGEATLTNKMANREIASATLPAFNYI